MRIPTPRMLGSRSDGEELGVSCVIYGQGGGESGKDLLLRSAVAAFRFYLMGVSRFVKGSLRAGAGLVSRLKSGNAYKRTD